MKFTGNDVGSALKNGNELSIWLAFGKGARLKGNRICLESYSVPLSCYCVAFERALYWEVLLVVLMLRLASDLGSRFLPRFRAERRGLLATCSVLQRP